MCLKFCGRRAASIYRCVNKADLNFNVFQVLRHGVSWRGGARQVYSRFGLNSVILLEHLTLKQKSRSSESDSNHWKVLTRKAKYSTVYHGSAYRDD